MILNKKILATAALASILLPAAASAHEGITIGASQHDGRGDTHFSLPAFGLRADVDHREDGDGHAHEGTHEGAQASTTAVGVTHQATRINATADFLATISPSLAARIASSSLDASTTAAAQAKLSGMTSAAASAKTQANAALAVAAQMGSTTASSTLAAQAHADLSAAKSFLLIAKQDLMAVIHFIFGK